MVGPPRLPHFKQVHSLYNTKHSFASVYIDFCDLCALLQGAIGAKVILTNNVNVKAGAANGCTGRIVAFNRQGERIKSITVEMDTSKQLIRVWRSSVHMTWFNTQAYQKKTFPMMLGYAITAHRCQGATVSKGVILHVSGAFAPGLLYVMLSRVTESRLLSIITPLSPNNFHPMDLPDIAKV